MDVLVARWAVRLLRRDMSADVIRARDVFLFGAGPSLPRRKSAVYSGQGVTGAGRFVVLGRRSVVNAHGAFLKGGLYIGQWYNKKRYRVCP